jgi:Fe-S-cluster containining protein
MSHYLPVHHGRFRRAHRDVFLRRVTPDCMSHTCSLLHEGHRVKLDACCQHGADVDLGERDEILGHADQIRALLRAEVKHVSWFSTDVEHDADFPSGALVRSARHGEGCIFLAHDRRGCAIHRAALAGGWDLAGVKPHVCRLFPLSYTDDAIVLSDDYADYSCSLDAAAPSVYRVARDAVRDVFGAALVAALDEAEARALGKLRVLL